MKKTIKVKKLGNLLVIDDELYQPEFDKSTHADGEYIVFTLIKKKDYLKKIDLIADQLSKKLNSKEVVRNALGQLPVKNIEKLYRTIFVKKKKIRARQRHGCYEMLVAGEIIPISG